MFVFSVKTDRKQLAWGLTGVIAVLAAVIVAVAAPSADREVGGKAVDWRASSSEERVQLLSNLGYAAAEETVREVRVPDEPDAVLQEYEDLQTPAGLSLLKATGKRVKLYTYTAADPQTGDTVKIHLYVYRERVIAGDITTAGAAQQPLIK